MKARQCSADQSSVCDHGRHSIMTKQLYFTAFIDEKVDEYIEADPANPRHLSTYSPGLMNGLLKESGWRIEQIYPPSSLQQTAFVCSPL